MRPRSEAIHVCGTPQRYRNYVRSYVQHTLGILLRDKDATSVVVGFVKVTLIKFGSPEH